MSSPGSISTRLSIVLGALAIVTAARADEPSSRPRAIEIAAVPLLETEPVPSTGDSADDPAIWVHPDHPEHSLVLGTDKKGGLNVFDLDGKRLQIVPNGSRPNNVDVLYGFPLAGRPVDLAVAGTRSKGRMGLTFWRIDPESRTLSEVGPVLAFPVFGGGEPYGSCVYRSPRDGTCFAFVTSKEGAIEQYRLATTDRGEIAGTLVRSVSVGSTAEGCVTDLELGFLYVAEEAVGIWRFGAEPDSGTARTLVARVGEHGLEADVEGLTIYYATGGRGYLIASSQGAGRFNVYERAGSHAFVASIKPSGGIGETDGIDVTNVATSPRFPGGLFVCQDGRPRDGHQNFKLFSWGQIAGDRLIVDTKRPARNGSSPQ
jgi:3-phytase